MNPDSDWAPQPNIGILTSRRGDHAAIVLTKKETVYGNPLISMVATVRRDKLSEIHKCDDDRCTAERLALLHWSSDGSSVYFIAEQKRGAAGIYEWRPSNGKVRAILETDGLLGALASGGRRYKSSSCPVVEEFAFCTAADPENPPRLMAISLPSGSARTVFDPNAELRKRFSLKAERVFWKDGLERDAVGVLVYPREFEIGTRYPLVITTYKCPGFLMGGIADGGPEYVLAENGFLVLCIDRNPDVYDTLRPEYSRAEARYISALAEYESAIDMLVKSGLADRQRVGVTGLSASSQSVSYALTHSDIFHVAALRAIGVWEPGKSMFYRRGMALAEAVKEHNGIGENGREAKDVYESLSVTLRAERITAPILAQASDSEYLGSLPAFAALHNLGKPIEMIVFPDEAHQLHQPMHRYVNFTRNLDWFRFWLQGYEGPDPEKQEQYGRWRKMREQQCERLKGEDTPTYCLQ